MAEPPRIAVAGATSWGITLAHLFATNGATVTVLARTDDEVARLTADDRLERLPQVRFSERIAIAALQSPPEVDFLVLASPAQFLRQTATTCAIPRIVPVLSASKGIERDSLMTMTAVLADLGWPAGLLGTVSGPNLAHEVVGGSPSAAVVATNDPAVGAAWQEALAGRRFRVYTSDDVIGVEIAGAFKNIVAIACGAAAGLGHGANTIAALMTRGLAEMTRLGVALGARPDTYRGLAGVGDLAATCFSPLSRNRRFGDLLAQNLAADEAIAAIGQAVEGARTVEPALRLAATHDVELPVAEAVRNVIGGEFSVAEAMAALLSRPPTAE